MKLTVNNVGESHGYPLGQVETLLNNCKIDVNSGLGTDSFIKEIIDGLNKISNKYKYIVSVTKIARSEANSTDLPESNEMNLEVQNSVGTSFNQNKDGVFNYSISQEGNDYLITVIWVHYQN